MKSWKSIGLGAAIALALVGCATPTAAPSWHFSTLDGAGGTNGRLSADLGTDTASVIIGATKHVFYSDATHGDLRHASGSGTSWSFATLDGQGTAGGRTTDSVGTYSSALAQDGNPEVYYYDATAGNLRTARWTGAVWTFAALDGAGGTGGQLNEDVGLYTSAISYLNHPRVFYYDATAGTLRYAVRVGTTWHYATLDGQGGAAGQTGDAVGEDIATVVFGGVLHVYYYDMTSGDQREAVLQPSGAWSYSTLDGEGGAAGHINADTGQFNAATVVGNTLHVLSHDATNGDLRHAWLTAGVWHFETLDGNTTVGGRTTNETGTDNLALTVGSTLQLWYSDETGGVLRHASLDAFGWHFENLDGLGGAAGRINAVVGEYVTGVTDGTSMDIWYFADAGDLRYAQFA